MISKKYCPLVYIIILNYNGLNDTLECLNSLKKIKYKNKKIVVIDNGSINDEINIIKDEYANDILTIRLESNFGFTGGNNIGIQFAIEKGADYVLILNNDVIVHKLFLTKLIEKMELMHNVGIAGPVVYCYDKPNEINSMGGEINITTGNFPPITRIKIDDLSQNNKDFFYVDYIVGCCMLIKKDVIKKINYFDHNYFLYADEVDYSYRASKEGYKIICVLSSKIWHKIGKSSNDEIKLYFRLKNKLYFNRKHSTSVNKVVFLFIFLLYQIPRLSYSMFKSNPLLTLKIIRRALEQNYKKE